MEQSNADMGGLQPASSVTASFDPQVYFKTPKPEDGKGPIWNNMDRLLKGASAVKLTRMASVSHIDLPSDFDDHYMRNLLDSHYHTELWQVAQLIERQKNGEKGNLLINGKANIFYIGEHVLRLRWLPGSSVWCGDAWEFGTGKWESGCRVFCPA